eukprot:TRINITY_DN4514_c0_g1_i2.p1 TRINITY_DN4514_c0_g1~~TRINITY_DN4514_c0_g1_i2.p1  ORF type:complete len:644 (+),score=233.29 TRINITY_DN4514_c0_g1_i2:83-2014(+)
MIQIYIFPLRMKFKDDPNRIKYVEMMFSNIETICQVHKKLLGDLSLVYNYEKTLEENEESNLAFKVGKVFRGLANQLSVYTDYCVGYEQAIVLLGELSEDNIFKKHLEECFSSYKSQHLSTKVVEHLNAQLITPIQRICRYPLLFREVLNYTPQEHYDRLFLGIVLKDLEKVAAQVNKEMAIEKRYLEMKKIEESLVEYKGPTPLADRKRYLIGEDTLCKRNPNKDLQDRHFFLFDDYLMWTKPFKKKTSVLQTQKIVYKQMVRLEDILVRKFPQPKNQQEMTLGFQFVRMEGKKKNYDLFAKDEQKRDEWMKKIEEACEERKKLTYESSNSHMLKQMSKNKNLQNMGLLMKGLEKLKNDFQEAEKNSEILQQHLNLLSGHLSQVDQQIEEEIEMQNNLLSMISVKEEKLKLLLDDFKQFEELYDKAKKKVTKKSFSKNSMKKPIKGVYGGSSNSLTSPTSSPSSIKSKNSPSTSPPPSPILSRGSSNTNSLSDSSESIPKEKRGSGSNNNNTATLKRTLRRKKVLVEVRALEDFYSTDFDKLSFQKDEIISVTKNSNPSWWEGHITRKNKEYTGIFPSNKVKVVGKENEESSSQQLINTVNKTENIDFTNPIPISNVSDRKASFIKLNEKSNSHSSFILKTG